MRVCRVGLIVLVAIFVWLSGTVAQEQPIRIIYPFAAGGSGDGLARLVGDKLRTALNRNVIVENRTGAAGRPGVMAVKNAAPDGNTLLITPIAPMAVYQHVYKNLEYDPIKDFAAVSQIATFDMAVAVGPNVPVTSLKELIVWAKADPARAAFGSPGAGTLPTSWYGAFAPARTPRETVDRLSAAMAAAVRMPDVRERFLGWGLQPTGTTAAEFAAIQKADSERWASGVKASGFTAD